MDGNWLLLTFKYLVFKGELTVEEIRLKNSNFILRNKNTYQNIWEESLETYIQNLKRIEFGNMKRHNGTLWFNEIEY